MGNNFTKGKFEENYEYIIDPKIKDSEEDSIIKGEESQTECPDEGCKEEVVKRKPFYPELNVQENVEEDQRHYLCPPCRDAQTSTPDDAQTEARGPNI